MARSPDTRGISCMAIVHSTYPAPGVDREMQHAGRSAPEIAAAPGCAGGVGFAAHSFSAGARRPRAALDGPGVERIKARVDAQPGLLSTPVDLR